MMQATQGVIADLENRLCAAMLASDVEVLDSLLSPDLIFTNHFGQLTDKERDLAAYRSGLLRIMGLHRSEERILVYGGVAIVTVRTQISGEYGGHPANGEFRFTRVWGASAGDEWKVLAAHSTAVI